jgi:phosphate/phosphite/phosphonate ABC transporter binding protein
MSPPFIVFGYAAAETRAGARDRMVDFATKLGAVANVDIGVTPLPSYNELAQRIHHGDIDLAWLSPIPLISLERNSRVVSLASCHRDALVHYRSALIVAAGSPIKNVASLPQKRAAWVDPHSASGFVIPRMELATLGIQAQTLASEQFFGTHENVVRAVASARADFGATFARISRDDDVAGSWSQMPGLAASVRVLTMFGEIPPDAIAARADMDRMTRERIARALVNMASTDRDLIRAVFGADDLRRPQRTVYERLRVAVVAAYEAGHLDVAGAAPKRSPDATDEAEVIETFELKRVR